MLSLHYVLVFFMVHLIMHRILNFEKIRSVRKINIAIFFTLAILDVIRQNYYGYHPIRWYDAIIGSMLINAIGIYSFATDKTLATLFVVPVVYFISLFMNMIASSFTLTLLGFGMYNLYINPIYSLIGVGLGASLLCILYLIITKLKLQLNVQSLTKGEVVFIVFFIGIFGFYVNNFYAFGNARYYTIWGQVANLFALVSGITAVYGILYLITQKNETQAMKNNEQQQLVLDKQQQVHYAKMEARDTEFRSFKHDIKEELTALEALIGANKLDKSLTHIAQMKGELKQIVQKTGTETGSLVVNANLLAIESRGQFNGLKANWHGMIPNNLKIESRDLSLLFSNLLKNAFEATSKVSGEGYVNVNIKTKSNLFWIQVANNFDGKVKRHLSGELATSKQDSLNHGFGTKTIKKVVTKYNGEIQFENTADEFVVTIAFNGAIYEREEVPADKSV